MYIYKLKFRSYLCLPFSLDSFGSFTIPGCFEVFETFSGPKEFSALVRNAEDDEEEGIITGVEVVFCVRADELHADKDTRESLLKELLPTSTKMYNISIKLNILTVASAKI